MRAVIALGKTAKSNRIHQKEVSIRGLFKALTKHEIREKKDGNYFIFASFKGNRRNAHSVDKYYGATIDLDDTPLSIDEIREEFADFNYCIYTTHSHKLPGKGDRYRLVLPFSEPVNPQKYVQTILVLMHRLGASNVDTSSKALSRPMYLPACPAKKRKYSQAITHTKGKYFNPYEDANLTKAEQWEIDQQQDHEFKEKFDPNEEYSEGGRNDALTRLVGKFIHNGMDMNTIIGSSLAWNDANCSPPLSENEVKTIVESVYKAHKRNSKDSGWGADEIKRRIDKMDKDQDYDLAITLIAGSREKLKKSQVETLCKKASGKFGITLGTVKSELKEKFDERKIDVEEEEEEKQQLSAKGLKKEFADFIYLRLDDKVYCNTNGLRYGVDGFNRTYSHMTDKGTLLSLLLQYKCIKQADLRQFHPSEKEIFREQGIIYANSYVPVELDPEDGDVSPMLDHFKYLIPDRKERNILLNWIAFVIQNPGEKVRWMPILKGNKGIGKSIISDQILVPLLGLRNVTPVTSKVLKSDFNAWQIDTQLCVFHELKAGETLKERQHVTDTIKEFVTDPYIQAHFKGVDTFSVHNRCNALAFTNHEQPVIITPDERRFCFIKTGVRPKSSAYYKKLIKWFTSHHSEMYHYFLNRKIRNFNESEAPDTAATRELKLDSMLWPMNVINQMLNDKEHPMNIDGCMTWANIVEYVRHESAGRDLATAENLVKASSSQGYKLTNALKELGFVKWSAKGAGDRARVNGSLEKIWLHPNHLRLQGTKAAIKLCEKQKSIWDFEDESE